MTPRDSWSIQQVDHCYHTLLVSVKIILVHGHLQFLKTNGQQNCPAGALSERPHGIDLQTCTTARSAPATGGDHRPMPHPPFRR